ncbi:preprotein translocase subunit SecY [Vulcanisaeta souniana]|uniref:Protein translocase subunit SecY n=1 Tax=Vulcanisaeta souniana JCM 11219 TaxID=1293586 RepID=A0A830DY88_9CREN|nr:preprotein translocase subunit SecY [Vulcanisaeta souniana]BDR92041.1 preprotein translocase subunit SecY [Vulcanisaeta souniana JCM 11219]GGI68371.1 preprotein translocase subunit SecY [Vulcanisaeta souniana JCM 11219]
MASGGRRFIDVVEPILRLMPTVPKPKEALSMGSRLFWTFLSITVYLLMSITPLYGLSPTTPSFFMSPAIASILGITFGSLAQLGITPIVVAGIILEILVFSDMINVDLEDPEDQAKFNALLKLLAIVFGLLESIALVTSGQLIPVNALGGVLIIIQLLVATLIIILMDDLISKGWGLGSGISLFILVTIVKQMFAMTFSPFILPGSTIPYGAIPALATAIYYAIAGKLSYLMTILYQVNLPSLTGLIATIALALIVLYLELMEVSIPVALVQYRGYRYSVPLKLMYVSVLPIIFTAYTVYLVGEGLTLIWSAYNKANANPFLNWLACAHSTTVGLIPCPNSLLYYFTVVPRNIDAAYIAVHIVMYAVLSVVFAIVWVNLAGLSAEDQAKYIIQGGMQIPGFRPSARVIARFLDRYVRMLTVISGLIVGVIAALGDIAGVFGGGIGLILVVEIIIQYYSLAMQEQLFEIYPGLKRLLGKE